MGRAASEFRSKLHSCAAILSLEGLDMSRLCVAKFRTNQTLDPRRNFRDPQRDFPVQIGDSASIKLFLTTDVNRERFSRPKRTRRDFSDQGGDGAIFHTLVLRMYKFQMRFLIKWSNSVFPKLTVFFQHLSTLLNFSQWNLKIHNFKDSTAFQLFLLK